jgi:hypothetical protein
VQRSVYTSQQLILHKDSLLHKHIAIQTGLESSFQISAPLRKAEVESSSKPLVSGTRSGTQTRYKLIVKENKAL